MNIDGDHVGRRFSQVYHDHGPPVLDSKRFRNKLQAHFVVFGYKIDSLAGAVERGTGIKLGYVGYGARDWADFFTKAALRDVLDSITIIYQQTKKEGHGFAAREWISSVATVFREENIGYRLDAEGGVRFLIDEQHAASRLATLRGLDSPRYSAVRVAFEGSGSAIDAIPPDTRSAVRGMFDALEITFKLMLGDRVSRLGATEIEKQLRPLALGASMGAARNAAGLMVSSFKEWVNAAHQYRHNEGSEDPAPPPIEIAILMMGSGASFLRWLIEIDRAAQPSG